MCRFSGNITYFIAKTLPFTEAQFRCWNFQIPAPIKGKMVNKQGDFSPCAPSKFKTTAKNLFF
jgi:hypothetical protein